MSKSLHQREVEEFMQKGGQTVPQVPTMPDEATRWLRAKLILEEALETVAALGFDLDRRGQRTLVHTSAQSHGDFTLSFSDVPPNMIEIVDGCCDVAVVTTGTLSACGIPDVPFQHEVNQSNLSKFKPGWWKRDDGKIMKSPEWCPPQIARILESFGWKE